MVRLSHQLRSCVQLDDLAELKRQCQVWSGLSDDLSWLQNAKLGQKKTEAAWAQIEQPGYWTTLTRIYSQLGLSYSLSVEVAQETARAFAILRPFKSAKKIPSDRLHAAASVGAVRGQICFVADLLSGRGQSGNGEVVMRARKLLVKVALILPTPLLFMASTNADSIPDNLKSYGNEVIEICQQAMAAVGSATFTLKPEMVHRMDLSRALAINDLTIEQTLTPPNLSQGLRPSF